MADDKLLTVEEFNNQVTKWAMDIRQDARDTLAWTDGTGNLSRALKAYADNRSSGTPIYKIKFDFPRYGAYRAYGVGRGYIRVNGNIVRGYRIRSNSDIRRGYFSEEARSMRGYSIRDINVAKRILKSNERIKRTPLDWLDSTIDDSIEVLGDLVQEFYGDDALRKMISNFNNLKIDKE